MPENARWSALLFTAPKSSAMKAVALPFGDGPVQVQLPDCAQVMVSYAISCEPASQRALAVAVSQAMSGPPMVTNVLPSGERAMSWTTSGC